MQAAFWEVPRRQRSLRARVPQVRLATVYSQIQVTTSHERALLSGGRATFLSTCFAQQAQPSLELIRSAASAARKKERSRGPSD